MWQTLVTAAILAALASKIASVATRLLLAAVAKCGLLSNIRAGDAATVSLAVATVRFSFWSSTWSFLRAPTQNPLLCVEALHVHVRVAVNATALHEARAATTERSREDPLTRLAALLDLDVSFTDIRHRVWGPARAWIHRFGFVCYFAHLVTLSVSSIAVDVVDESAGDDALVSIKQLSGNSFWAGVVLEMEVQLKVTQVEVFVQPLLKQCAILPDGVPSLLLLVEEINVFAHPFADDQALGVRSKADIQCSRLKILSCARDRSARACFISVDFTRVFVEPTSLMYANQCPADVEMEAEWLEVKWSPQALHAVGGMIELGVFVARTVLKEDASCDQAWGADAKTRVPAMSSLEDVYSDKVADSEALKFRCSVKRVLVLFAHTFEDQSHVDYVTVDSLAMSVEESTGRFRIAVFQTKVFHTEPDKERPFTNPSFADQRPPRRTSSTFATKRVRAARQAGKKPRNDGSWDSDAKPEKASSLYLTVQSFALEENRLPGCPKTVVDILVDSVHLEWAMAAQLRVMELVRRITLSVWEMLFVIRRGYAVYCTPLESRYNRLGGVNPPIEDSDECLRCSLLLDRLISASGGSLNRIVATNVNVNTRVSNETLLHLRVGHFGGDDLPDLWRFESISFQLNSLTVLAIDTVSVRHSVDKRTDYVFGEFEEALLLRMAACGKRPGDAARDDGMLIGVDGVRVRMSTQVPFLHHMRQVRDMLEPFTKPLKVAAQACWRPQRTMFYQYFLRTPVTPGRAKLWLSVENLSFECSGAPLESWLERMYPLWLEELQEQALREQVLEEQVATLKLTNAEMLCNDAFEDMKALLAEKNAKIYIQKAKKAHAASLHALEATNSNSGGALFVVRIGRIVSDVSFEGDRRKAVGLMHSLDEATKSAASVFARYNRDLTRYTPSLDLLEVVKLSVAMEDVVVQLRNFATPLLLCGHVAVSGSVAVAAPSECEGSERASLAARLRCYADLRAEIGSPVAYFGPSYICTLGELACLAQRLLPLALFDIDKRLGTPPWDIARRLFHGNVSVSIHAAALRLLNCSTSFVASDYLEIAVERLAASYLYGKTDLSLHRVTAKIDPGALTNIVEVSNVSLQVWTKWSTEGQNSEVHYGFPIEFCGDTSDGTAGDRVYLDAWASRVVVAPDQMQNIQAGPDPLKPYQATGLSVFIRGTVCPWDVGSDGSQLSTIKRTKHEVSTRTAIVMYTKHVEWLLQFAALYLKLPSAPIPRRARGATTSSMLRVPLSSFLRIAKGVVVEEFIVTGLDLALYHSEKNPIGIRAFVNDQVAISGALLTSTHAMFQQHQPLQSKKSGRKPRRLNVSVGGHAWTVHDVSVSVQDVQVRVCTRQSGSRGESLVSVKHMALKVGGGSERAPTHDGSGPVPSHASLDRLPDEVSDPALDRNGRSDSRTRTKKTILDHFAIEQHNPYCFRDTDHDAGASNSGEVEMGDGKSDLHDFVEEFRRLGFLMGLFAREARILITMDATEALVDIVENWSRIATVCVPELLGDASDAIATEEKANGAAAAQDDSSPRKATQLAEDPKFGAIFYESVVRDEANSFVTRLLPPVFVSGDAVQPTSGSESDTLLGSAGASVVESFFMVKFADCQVSVQDPAHKGSMLLALSCGSLKDSISSDACHELIDLKVDGVQLFTAPLDIDVKSRIVWLKTLPDGAYCPSSHGLLKQVIAPIPAKVAVWVDRNAVSVLNKIDLQIPTIQVGLNVTSKDILQNLVQSLTTVIAAKVAETKAPDFSKMLKGATHGGDASDPRSILALHALKKQLKWKITELQWRQTCRWSCYVAERAKVAFAAAEGSRTLAFEMETSPLFRGRSASSASSIGTAMSLSASGTAHGGADRQSADDMLRLTQQYESVSDVLHNLVTQQQKRAAQRPSVELEFVLQSASLTLSSANQDIVRVSMSSLRFTMKQFEDQSGAFTLTLQALSTQNLCPGTPYPDLLQPSSTSAAWGGGDAIVWVDSEIAAPVGGVTVVKHFEVNVHPLQVCITQEVVLHLVAFFGPPAASRSAQERHDEVRSTFLQARHAGAASDGLVGSALKRAAKVAEKAAHPLGFGKSHRDGAGSARGARRTRSFSTTHDPSSSLASAVTHANETQLLLLRGDDDDDDAPPSFLDAFADREASGAKGRATPTILFKHIRIGTVEVVVTYKNKKSHQHNQQPLEDMRGFEIKVHALVYCDKTCSMLDLALRIRRDVILDVLSQVGRNFTNIANFLRDQVEITRWGQFDALAPLKTRSTTIATSLTGAAAATPSSAMASVAVAAPLATKSSEPSPRARAAPSAPDTAQKFQLELPESHRALRKKGAASSLRPVEAVGRPPTLLSPPAPSPAPSPRRDADVDGDSDPSAAPRSQHRSTAGKAKHAIAHLFSKKRAGAPSSSPFLSVPSSPSKTDERVRSSVRSTHAATAAAAAAAAAAVVCNDDSKSK
ncbi:hypothetical protein PybrP1_001984 [[Pythium] brassicae (nom. inval.)]|nr:hypothetical protein PybrP1_001984 [[Pythium] brassicae (nom. inval.)]